MRALMIPVAAAAALGCADESGYGNDPRIGVCDEPLHTADWTCRDHTIVDHVVQLQAASGGGCGSGHYRMCWDETFEGTGDTTLARLWMTLEQDDDCEGVIETDVAFELEPVRSKALEVLPSGTETVLILVDGPEPARGCEEIAYGFAR